MTELVTYMTTADGRDYGDRVTLCYDCANNQAAHIIGEYPVDAPELDGDRCELCAEEGE